MRISDWSSDVCSSDLRRPSSRSTARTGCRGEWNSWWRCSFQPPYRKGASGRPGDPIVFGEWAVAVGETVVAIAYGPIAAKIAQQQDLPDHFGNHLHTDILAQALVLAEAEVEVVIENAVRVEAVRVLVGIGRSEEHTYELKSLMRISYAVF